MGRGFAILVWDSWGSGLVRINPRLLDNGHTDIYGNPNNWFPCKSEEQKHEMIKELVGDNKYYVVID